MTVVFLGLVLGFGEVNGFDRIQSVKVSFEETEDSCVVHAKVSGRSSNKKLVSQIVSLGSGPGAPGASRAYILDKGRLAIYNLHQLSRFNVVTGVLLQKGKLVVREQYSDSLYKVLPQRLQKDLVTDNVFIRGVKGDLVSLDFSNRDGRDGVKAMFRVHNQKWTCVDARYWRDKQWDGIRRF